MFNFESLEITGFGKIFYVPRNHTIPALPNMNLIILKNMNSYQAICIDVEIDCIGDSVEEACTSLKKRLLSYTTQMVSNYNGDVKAAAEEIISIAFSQGDTKTRLFNMYKNAKYQYMLSRLKHEKKPVSRGREFINVVSKIFQIEPIGLNLTLAAGLA